MEQVLNFNNPNIQIFLVPVILSFITTGLLRLSFGAWKGALLSAYGIGVGYIASYCLLRGFFIWPTIDALSILPIIIISGFIIGPVIDYFDFGEDIKTPIFVSFTLGIIYWVAGGNQGMALDTEGSIFYGLLIIGGIWVFQRLEKNKDDCIASPISCFSALLGLAIIGMLSGSDLGLHAMAFTSAIFGFLLWNWPRCRYPWSTTGSIISASGFLVLAILLVHEQPNLAFPVGFIFLTFLIYEISSRVFPSSQTTQPIIQLLSAGIPIAVSGFLVFFGV